MKTYVLTIHLDDKTPAPDEQAFAISMRIAMELGAQRFGLRELDERTGKSSTIAAASL